LLESQQRDLAEPQVPASQQSSPNAHFQRLGIGSEGFICPDRPKSSADDNRSIQCVNNLLNHGFILAWECLRFPRGGVYENSMDRFARHQNQQTKHEEPNSKGQFSVSARHIMLNPRKDVERNFNAIRLIFGKAQMDHDEYRNKLSCHSNDDISNFMRAQCL
jgi:hypothetical protein